MSKKFEIPKDVGGMLESWLNKVKEDRHVGNNITIVEPSGGTFSIKKIWLTNMNPEKIRKMEAIIVELMEFSDSSDSELDEDSLHCLLI
ncbi:unnamed protein product [Vicia faba]|uniref:Uncharacterized protein n=1 Tax=Vicia faba TaxID=3906 RepID=A0AAV1AS65_VICFA|nr:unnamed protein product [Vicia faba]